MVNPFVRPFNCAVVVIIRAIPHLKISRWSCSSKLCTVKLVRVRVHHLYPRVNVFLGPYRRVWIDHLYPRFNTIQAGILVGCLDVQVWYSWTRSTTSKDERESHEMWLASRPTLWIMISRRDVSILLIISPMWISSNWILIMRNINFSGSTYWQNNLF